MKVKSFGEVKYMLNGETLSTVNLIAKNTVKKLSLSNMLGHTFEKWFSMLRR